jgi:hypothetical protein
MPTPYGKNTGEVIKNLKELVNDYVLNEGKSDKFWSKLNMDDVDFAFSQVSFKRSG